MMNNDKNIKNIIDSRLSKLTVNQELENKILNNIDTKKIKKRSLIIAAAICLCIMLSVPVMAASIPTFNNFLYLVSPEIAQLLQPIEMISEDNGIKLEVIAAMNDDETAIVYLTLQDLTGNRIDKTVDLYNYSITGANMFTHELVSYDEDTRTATIRMVANGANKLNDKKVTVRVDSFLSGKEHFENIDTGIVLADTSSGTPDTILLNMNRISGGGGHLIDILKKKGTINILKPDQVNISLAGIDFVHISNIGYVDGRLHVQTKWSGSVDDHGTLYLINTANERINPSNVYFGIDDNGNAKYGGEYIEYIFEVEQSLASSYSLYGDFVKNNNYIEGKWNTTFRIKSVDENKKVIRNINFDNIKIDRVSITPIGINIIGNISAIDDIDIAIGMSNGKLLSLSRLVTHESNGKLIVKYLSNTPIEIQNIKEVRINGNILNFN